MIFSQKEQLADYVSDGKSLAHSYAAPIFPGGDHLVNGAV